MCLLHQGFRTLLMGSESGVQICKTQCLVTAVWLQVYLETQGSKNVTVTTTLTLKICDIGTLGKCREQEHRSRSQAENSQWFMDPPTNTSLRVILLENNPHC